LSATRGQHLGLRGLCDDYIDLGDAAGRANVGDKAMTIIHSALAGGDSIDDCDDLRAGSTAKVLGHTVLAPSTLGTFLRSFTWGHARQLDKVAAELLGRAWATGASRSPMAPLGNTRVAATAVTWPSGETSRLTSSGSFNTMERTSASPPGGRAVIANFVP
ncbi:MAG: hypothetical protein IIB66_09775, partial [Proteobacteria bacterium]|nr:hypothetical protein [Pseudomonadota bacterium]